MNKDRRKRILAISLRVEQLMQDLEEIKDEEQESLDNMPENLQESQRYYSMSEAIDYLDAAYDDMNDVLYNLTEAVS